jgi:glycosyltransferase involved in cell wall biosynthesis
MRIIHVLTDWAVTAAHAGPIRYLDIDQAGADCKLVVLSLFSSLDDVTIQKRTAWLKNTKARILFYRAVSAVNILRHLPALRRAQFIWCQAPHYFWWLFLLSRIGLLPTSGKTIGGAFYRYDSFAKKIRLFQRAPAAFKPFFCLPEQVEALAAAGAPRERIGLLRVRIDTDWFQPISHPTKDYILCAGSIQRDEALILKLIGRTPLKIIRVGQLSFLRQFYGHIPPESDAFELQFNLSYRRYLSLLQNAALVILPIRPCDEPAGLTAASEALACGVPLLTNDSLGIAELLQKGYGKAPIPSLDPEDWLAAITESLSGHSYPAEILRQAREYLVANHALLPDGPEWQSALGH